MNVLVDKQKIDLLANAISAKSGESLTLTLDEMVEAVDGIEAHHAPTLETVTKTYTPTESQQTDTITPSSGYDGIEEVDVTVNAIPSNYVGSGIVRRDSEDIWLNSSTGVFQGESGYYSSPFSYTVPTKSATAITPTESSQTAVAQGYYTTGAVTVNAIPSNYVGSGITQRSSSDLTASGATVTVPSGYYSAQASKSVSNGTAGTPTATKGSVSNHSVSVTPSVTNTTGWITGSTINGTAVTVTASELVSGSDTVTQNDTYDVTNLAEIVVNVPSGGGSVTVTDEANSTGITCVITSGGEPTPSGIPIGVELVDFANLTEDYAINSSGQVVAQEWYCVTDYTPVESGMTFSYTGCRWYYLNVYNASKERLRSIYIYNDATVDPDNTNVANGTLSGSELTNAAYVRITGVAVQSQYRVSLIRTA